MLTKAQELKPRLIELRRTIHRNPELGFDVFQTAELVARTLGELGVEAQTSVGKTGVVGYIGESEGPVIAIRADMDALPIQESNQVDYASQVAGKMHACGHDGHTTMLLGVAMLLAKEKLPGQIRLIFQPSEEIADSEGVSGAPRMIDDGAMKGVGAVIALHVDGTLETGKISVEAGKVSGAVDTFRAHVTGKGGHGAHPNLANDPIWLTTQVLNAMYAVPSRRIDPFQPSVLSLGVVRGGAASNVIPHSVYIEGTLRSMDEKVREQLLDEVKRCLEIARALGGDYQLEIERGYPSMLNDPGVVEMMQQVSGDLLGANGLGAPKQTLGAEDFSYMTHLAPGAMFNLGVKKPGGEPRYVHTPDFDLDEEALPIGAAMLAETALRLLKEPGCMNWVTPTLAIGSYRSTRDFELLRQQGVAAVLYLYENREEWPPECEALHLPIADGEPVDCQSFQQGCAFVRGYIAKGDKAIVVCGAGMSRSATFTLACLLEEGYALPEAWHLLKSHHPPAQPHPILWQSLIDCYQLPFTLKECLSWK